MGSAFLFPKKKGRTLHTPTPKTPKTPSFDQPPRTKEEILGRRKKLINNTNIPQHTIETIAQCIFPDILAYYLAKKVEIR